MKKRVKKVVLSRKREARKALAASLTRALVFSERIKTTKTKAKFTRKYIEKLVRLARKNTLVSNRRIFAAISDKTAVKKLIREIGPKFGAKTSGFTRIINLGKRSGDAAQMALLEFAYPVIEETKEAKETKETEPTSETKATKATKTAREARNAKKKS